jgi:hypothetical protein
MNAEFFAAEDEEARRLAAQRATANAAWDHEHRAAGPSRALYNGAADLSRASRDALQLVHWRDMSARLDGRYLIKGLLERAQTGLMLGEGGCGKTFLALDLALHVAAGMGWFGQRVTAGAVVYVAAEAGGSIVNRVIAWREHQSLAGRDIPFAAITSPIDLCHAGSGDLERLIGTISTTLPSPALVVIDTVSRVLAGGNENAPDDMGALVRALDQLRAALGCHVLAVHHLGKDISRGGRGHSLLRCAVDTEITVTRDDAVSIATAAITKQRDGITGHQIAFRLRPIELGCDVDGDPVTSCVVEPVENYQPDGVVPRRLPASKRRALELLADAISREGEVPPASNHIPAGVLCVPETVWRNYCYSGQVSGSNSTNAKQKAFKRAAGELVSAGLVGKWGDLVWLVER